MESGLSEQSGPDMATSHSQAEGGIDGTTLPVYRKALSAITLFVLFFATGVFDHEIWSPTEPAVAGVVWSMLRQHELAVPHIDGLTYVEKPPLYYWAASAVCAVRGEVQAGCLRLPAAIFGMLALAIVWRVGMKRRGETVACALVLIGATNIYFYRFAHRACTDIAAIFFCFACFALFADTTLLLPSDVARRRWHDLVLALTLAVSFYAKNFYTYYIVLPPILLFMLVRRQFRRALFLTAAVAVFTIVLLIPWCVALYQHGGWSDLRIVFLDNTVGRFFDLPYLDAPHLYPLSDALITEREHPRFGVIGLLASWAQWPMLVGLSLVALFRGRGWDDDYRLFLVLGFISIPLMLALPSTRPPSYLAPVLFFELLIVGEFLGPILSGVRVLAMWERVPLTLNTFLVAILLGLSAIVFPALCHRLAFLPWAAACVLALTVVAPNLRHAWTRPAALTDFLLLNAAICAGAMALVLPRLDANMASAPFFDAIRVQVEGRHLVTTYCDDRRLPLINYYLDRPIAVIGDEDAALDMLATDAHVGLILGSPLSDATRVRLSCIPHIAVTAPGGKDYFTFVAAPSEGMSSPTSRVRVTVKGANRAANNTR